VTTALSRILIVRLSALGDIIHALPVLAALREANPSATIDWVVDARHAGLFHHVEGVTRRIVVRAEASADRGDVVTFAGTVGFLGVVRFLRQQQYDVAFDLQGLIKSGAIVGSSGAARVIGFAPGRLREPQAAWFYSEAVTSPVDAHVVYKNLGVLSQVGITPGPPRFPLRVPASAIADEIAAQLGSYVVLNPGGGWPNKRWPPSRLGELAIRIRERFDVNSVVIWGKREEALADAVVAASDEAAVRVPATELGDLIAINARAMLVVSGDTGPLHIAGALGTPIVGLYGPTVPSRNGPWDADDEVVSRSGECDCYHKRECSRSTPCLNDVSVNEVFAAVGRRLAREHA
jgi:heptosyltransferase I